MSFAYVVCLWSCWNSGYELDIVATTRSNRVPKSFPLFFFSLSTELLEDKQGFKLGGVDTSPTYLLFRTLLPLFWTLICMIWMELTRTDAVFSRIAMVLFLCRNKSSRNVLKIYGDVFRNKRKIPAQRSTRGGGPVGHKPTSRGHPPSPPREGLWGPRGSTAPKLSSISSVSPEKKWERRFHRVLRYGGAATSCSSSGGQIWSPFRAPERGNRRHRHHQTSSIDNSMTLFTVLE